MATQNSLDFNTVGSVAAWQHVLNGCGYTPVLEITRAMDRATIEATNKFQKDCGLEQTGEVDLKTWQTGLKHRKLAIWRELPIPPCTKETADLDESIPQCGITLIKEFEGYHKKLPDGRAKAYEDKLCGKSVMTIGYGSTKHVDGSPIRRDEIITQQKAEELLAWEIQRVCKPKLEEIPTWSRMNQNQRGALYSFAYNLGASFYRHPDFNSITRVCDSPEKWQDEAWITQQFIKYRNPGSLAEAGLKRRRLAEAHLFCTRVS